MLTLAQLTSIVSFVAMAVSLWLGCYVVTRSPRSRLAWQAGLTLWSLGGIFVNLLVSSDPSPANSWWLGWPVNLPLALWYGLSLETLPADLARRQRPLLFPIYGQAVLLDVLLRGTPWIVSDRKLAIDAFIRSPSLGPLFPLLSVSLVGLSLLTLYNFWKARQAAANVALRKQLNSLVRGTVFSVSAILYLLGAIGLNSTLPTLPLALALGMGVGTLGYGIVRYSALVDGRILRYDFAFSGLVILIVSAIYLALLSPFYGAAGLPSMVAVAVVSLVIVTLSGYEFVRRWLDRPFLGRSEHMLRASLRVAATDVEERAKTELGPRSALAAVVVGVNATWGAIVVRDEDGYVIRASYHWKRVGARLADERLNSRELTILPPDAAPRPWVVVAPLVAERDPLGAILLGQPKGGSAYGERDLDLVAEAADRLASLMRHLQQREAHAKQIAEMLEAFRARERKLQADIEALYSPIGSKGVDLKRIAAVEDALRRAYDYSYLGEHPLAAEILARHRAATHLDRGKALNLALVAAVEKLRPAAAEPRELPPREWHPYLILRDAYVRGESNRDIMSRLYVSETTFHRTRRSALRAVTKALFEMEFPGSLPN